MVFHLHNLHVPLPGTLCLLPINLLNLDLSFKTQSRYHLLQKFFPTPSYPESDSPPLYWSPNILLSEIILKRQGVPFYLKLNVGGGEYILIKTIGNRLYIIVNRDKSLCPHSKLWSTLKLPSGYWTTSLPRPDFCYVPAKEMVVLVLVFGYLFRAGWSSG